MENILNFSSTFPQSKRITLSVNYRTTQSLLDGAHAVIANNTQRLRKKVTAHAGRGELIRHFQADDEEEEAQWIADTIAGHARAREFNFSDHAILVRTNSMMRRFEMALRQKNIPYSIVGGMSFFERKEIKDVLSYMRFFSNPHDELSLERVLKVPAKGLSSASLNALESYAGAHRIGLWDAVCRGNEIPQLDSSRKAVLCSLRTLYEKYHTRFSRGPLASTFRDLLDECNYFPHLKRASERDEEYAQRQENITELLHGLESWEVKRRRKKPSLDSFVQQLTLSVAETGNPREETERNGVALMTLHKAKGLEFPVVFLAGLDADVIPSPRSVEEGRLEEERRLFYVGMTRARRRLICTVPQFKIVRRKNRKVIPSPFLRQIPEEFLDGIFGEREQEAKEEFLDDFFSSMHRQLAGGNADAEHVHNRRNQ